MTEEQKQRNIRLADALQSGEYEQGFGKLKHGIGHCCLGVACDIYRQDTGNGYWSDNDDFVLSEFNVSISYPPDEVIGYYGWNNDSPALVIQNKLVATAASLNDTYRATFIEIGEGFRDLARKGNWPSDS